MGQSIVVCSQDEGAPSDVNSYCQYDNSQPLTPIYPAESNFTTTIGILLRFRSCVTSFSSVGSSTLVEARRGSGMSATASELNIFTYSLIANI